MADQDSHTFTLRAWVNAAWMAVTLAVYGSQVCPLMARVAPFGLAVVMAVAFAVVFAIHPVLERRVVFGHDFLARPRRQFLLAMAMTLAAGALAALGNGLVFGLPFLSGLKLMTGAAATAFFTGMDMALARQRANIKEATRLGLTAMTGGRAATMSSRLALTATLVVLVVTVILVLVLVQDLAWLKNAALDPALWKASPLTVTLEIFFVMAILLALCVNLILSYSKNLRLLFENQTGVLARVEAGDLSALVPVASGDEFGIIAGHTNSMIRALRHRIELMTGLRAAEEVQTELLPQAPPDVEGASIAAKSVYCDETGGDYYDFLDLPDGCLGIAVGDVSGHGIGPALLMASARAYVRMAAQDDYDPGFIVARTNENLTRDVGDTGRFLTLFFLALDPKTGQARFVRAGHEPGLVYDPSADSFSDLNGPGMILGADPDASYGTTSDILNSGSVVVLATDGIREAMDPEGNMFGNDLLRDMIRSTAHDSPAMILDAILGAVEVFQNGRPREDDMTLVVIKLDSRPLGPAA